MEWARRYFASEASTVRAKTRKRRLRRQEEGGQGSDRSRELDQRAVSFQLPEESPFELYAASGGLETACPVCTRSVLAVLRIGRGNWVYERWKTAKKMNHAWFRMESGSFAVLVILRRSTEDIWTVVPRRCLLTLARSQV
ncbi:hypothetical protein PC123_g18331 [Phytophthora cactorum]|nr:hypothetical protein PC120_g17556 [Phytophthora cactorum]KAG4046284.1 hypothetical protein PC123_g18331 [Phytophthora cactorum]